MAKSLEQNFEVVCFIEDSDMNSSTSRTLLRLERHTTRVFSGSLKEASMYVKTAKAPKVICIDCGQQELLVSKVEEFMGYCPLETQVIILGNRNDVSIFRDLLRLDVADYLVKPFIPDIFLTSIYMALGLKRRQSQESSRRTGKIIGFLGTRGGIGTTTLAVNSAYALAGKQGKRVLLIDSDLQFGTVTTLLNLKATQALQEAIEDPERVDDIFLENAMASYDERLRVLSSEASLQEAPDVTLEAFIYSFEQLLNIVSRKFHYIIIDFSRYPSAFWQSLNQKINTLFLISDLTVASLRDTLRMYTLLNEGLDSRRTVIINHARNNYVMTLRKFEELLGERVDMQIAFEESAIEAADLGIPLIKHKSSFHKEIGKITMLISGQEATLMEKESSLKSLWKRLVGKFSSTAS